MTMFELRKKSLAALLLAFMASAMLPACSSDEEEAAEDCENASTADEKEACLQDLPV